MPAEAKACLQTVQTRTRLIDAGQMLFSAQGYAATSMRQVADAAGLALGGIYNHFPSKEAIFQAILLENNPLKKQHMNSLPECIDRKQIINFLEELEQQPEFINLILIELLEFKGVHLPKLFEDVSGGQPPPPSWLNLVSLLVSYHVTQTLIANALPQGGQRQISLNTFLDNFLSCINQPE